MKLVVGRKREQQKLESAYTSQKPEFIVLYGRRRVGKTYLVRNTFETQKDSIFLYVTGRKNSPQAIQIKHFTQEVATAFFGRDVQLEVPKNWEDAFRLLDNQIVAASSKKIVLFFDEFPWMVTRRSGLLQALDGYWNHRWSRDSRIKLIVCGSSSGWLLTHIINDTGGFYNRITQRIHLRPFSLDQTKNYLAHNKISLQNKQIAHVYMVLGGIPHYLNQIKRGLSAVEVVEQLAFDKDSFLLAEFDNLYATLFGAADGHIELARIIAKHHYGIGQEDLTREATHISSGQGLLSRLEDLVEADFIERFKPYHHKKKGIYYKMVDEYSLFYFHWIEPIRDTLLHKGMRQGYWESMQRSQKWNSWAGYAFESLCYKHIPQISIALKLSPTAIPNTWKYTAPKRSHESGAQIDLLFDRDDGAITVCEIKYTDKPFILDKRYTEDLLKKIDIFKTKTHTDKQIFIAFISSSGLKPTLYTEDIVSQVVVLDDLFREIKRP